MSELNPGGGRRTMQAEQQTSASTLPPSLVRTLIPILAGLVGTWLVNTFAVTLDSATAGALVSAAIGYVYYALARFLEVYGSDKWGFILGFRKLPVYATPPLGDAVVIVDDSPERNDAGAATFSGLALPLVIIGAVLILLTVTVVTSHVLLVIGVVAVVVGLALLLVGRS